MIQLGAVKHDQDKFPVDYLPLSLLSEWLHQYGDIIIPSNPKLMLDLLAVWYEGADINLHYVISASITSASVEGFTGAARVFKAANARKIRPYEKWDWIKGQPWSVVYAAAQRHLLGEIKRETDEETGMPHIWHVQANLIMLLYYTTYHKNLDNRPRGIYG